MRYYAIVNNLPLIDSLSIKWLIRTLKNFYPDIGTVSIVDETKTLIKTIILGSKNCCQEQPNNDQNNLCLNPHDDAPTYFPINIVHGKDTWLIGVSEK